MTDRMKVQRRFDLPESALSRLCIIGTDEAGTGGLAGPLVAAAYAVLPPPADSAPTATARLSFLDDTAVLDSKAMSERARDELFGALMAETKAAGPAQHPAALAAIEVAPTDLIDGVANITNVRLNFMSNAVRSVARQIKAVRPDAMIAVVVDGEEMPIDLPSDFPLTAAIAKADAKFLAVAAASVLAKVSRDRAMVAFDAEYPGWGFADHKGYGTAAHTQRIVAAQGKLTPIHRMTFVQNFLPK
jgi:ribonuclease HII